MASPYETTHILFSFVENGDSWAELYGESYMSERVQNVSVEAQLSERACRLAAELALMRDRCHFSEMCATYSLLFSACCLLGWLASVLRCHFLHH